MLTTILAIVGTLTGVSLVVIAMLPLLRAGLLKSTNEMLSTALKQEREERLEEAAKCKTEIAELRGQVQQSNHQFAMTIAGEVLTYLKEARAHDVS